jgi:hypothetical protein
MAEPDLLIEVEAVACWRKTEECPRQDSNLRPCLRRAVLYPLSYGGSSRSCREDAISPSGVVGPRPSRGPQGAGSGVPPRSASMSVIRVVSAAWDVTIESARSRTAWLSACSAAYSAISVPPW